MERRLKLTLRHCGQAAGVLCYKVRLATVSQNQDFISFFRCIMNLPCHPVSHEVFTVVNYFVLFLFSAEAASFFLSIHLTDLNADRKVLKYA